MSTSSNSPEDELVDDYGEEAAVAAVPTSSSQVSPPSGLPVSTIARLTHDELMHNAVFVKYVSLVDALLVKTHSNPRKSFLIFSLAYIDYFYPAAAPAALPPQTMPQAVVVHGKMTTPLAYPRPAIHPAHYVFEVLWTMADCLLDPDADVSPANRSCPPMQRCIRHPDGCMISDSEWKSIREAACIVSHTWIESIDTSTRLMPGKRRKKKFYKLHFPSEWDTALQELERMAPLLSLCAVSWKADQVLGSVLPDEVSPSDIPLTPVSSQPPPHSRNQSVAPPSRSTPSRHRDARPGPSQAFTPSVAPISRASQASSHSDYLPPPPTPQHEPPPPASKVASKVKRQHDPSPAPPNPKKTKCVTAAPSGPGASSGRSGEFNFTTKPVHYMITHPASRSRPAPRPTFLTMVEAGVPSKEVSFSFPFVLLCV